MLLKEEKFKKLVDDNHRRIWRICRYYAPTAEDQKDIYQEVLMNIWKSLDTFRGDAAISTWIYRIAINTSLGFAGKEKRRIRLHSGTEPDLLLRQFRDEEPDAGLKEQLLSQLETQINQLSVIDKLLISLMLEDLSTREIADIVGITEPNVRVKIHRIKELLSNQMKEQGHGSKG